MAVREHSLYMVEVEKNLRQAWEQLDKMCISFYITGYF